MDSMWIMEELSNTRMRVTRGAARRMQEAMEGILQTDGTATTTTTQAKADVPTKTEKPKPPNKSKTLRKKKKQTQTGHNNDYDKDQPEIYKELHRVFQEEGHRVIAKIRQYDGTKYGPYKAITLKECDAYQDYQGNLRFSWTHHLRRGGTVSVYPKFIGGDECQSLKEELGGTNDFEYRQYPVQNGFEQRVHVLVSCVDKPSSESTSSDEAIMYKYHTTTMKAHYHVSELKALDTFSQRAAAETGVDQWEIGCDVLLYRNGNDKIGMSVRRFSSGD